LTAAPNPASLLIALRRRWLVAATVGILLAGGASVGVWTWMPPAKATARTLVNIQGTSWLWKDSAQHTSTTDPRTHIALLKSRLVLTSALKQPKVAALDCIRKNPEPVEWLEKELQADFSAAPDVLRISLSGDNPSELITLVNEIRDAYKREVIDKERIDANARLVWLGQQREQYESRLRQSKEMQRELERKTPKDASTRNLLAGFAQQQLFFYEREIIQTQSEIRRLTAELTVQKNLEKAPADGVISPRIIEELLEKDPDYQKAQGKVRETRRLMDEFLSRSVRGEKDPGMARFRETLKQEEAAVTQLHQQLIPVYEDIIKKRRGFDFAVNTQQLETRLQVLREDEKALTALLEAQRKRIEDMANDVVRLEDLREDMSAQEKFAKRIADEEEGLKLALKVPERFTVIEEGVVTRPSELRRLLMAIGLVSLGSLGLTCLGVALWEFRAGRVSTPDDVAQDLGLNLVGTIPDAAQRYPRRGRSRRDDEANSALAEAVDATRTMLLRAAKAESLQTVMVTSAQSGEGKTLLATHLAASMAQIGHKVLLIDADLRNPIAHQVFGLEQEPGLCEFLVGDASLDDVIRQTPIDHLWMITAGHWDSRATRALAQDATRDLLQTLREQFEFIIIDTSPVLPVVDPLLIGQHIDGAIISVLRDVSRMARVYAAHQRLVNGGVRVLGAVVNGVRGEMYTGKYGYKYASRSAVRQPD
jgi:capsular exopolysaccharide synthesis family protein